MSNLKPLFYVSLVVFCLSFSLPEPAYSGTSFSGWVNSTLTKAHKTSKKVGRSINNAVPNDVKAGARKTGNGIADTSKALGRAAEPVLRSAAEGTVNFLEKLHW